MKKTYSKPEIVFEDFTLSTAIAGPCGNPTSTPAAMQCGVSFGGTTIFVANVTGCATKVEDDGTNGYCYNVPTADSNLFNS